MHGTHLVLMLCFSDFSTITYSRGSILAPVCTPLAQTRRSSRYVTTTSKGYTRRLFWTRSRFSFNPQLGYYSGSNLRGSSLVFEWTTTTDYYTVVVFHSCVMYSRHTGTCQSHVPYTMSITVSASREAHEGSLMDAVIIPAAKGARHTSHMSLPHKLRRTMEGLKPSRLEAV
jgi:hypothetical protein